MRGFAVVAVVLAIVSHGFGGGTSHAMSHSEFRSRYFGKLGERWNRDRSPRGRASKRLCDHLRSEGGNRAKLVAALAALGPSSVDSAFSLLQEMYACRAAAFMGAGSSSTDMQREKEWLARRAEAISRQMEACLGKDLDGYLRHEREYEKITEEAKALGERDLQERAAGLRDAQLDFSCANAAIRELERIMPLLLQENVRRLEAELGTMDLGSNANGLVGSSPESLTPPDPSRPMGTSGSRALCALGSDPHGRSQVWIRLTPHQFAAAGRDPRGKRHRSGFGRVELDEAQVRDLMRCVGVQRKWRRGNVSGRLVKGDGPAGATGTFLVRSAEDVRRAPDGICLTLGDARVAGDARLAPSGDADKLVAPREGRHPWKLRPTGLRRR